MISDERYQRIQNALKVACGTAEGTPLRIYDPVFPKYDDNGQVVSRGRAPFLDLRSSLGLVATSVADKIARKLVRRRPPTEEGEGEDSDTIVFPVRDESYASYLDACQRLCAFVSEIRAEVYFVRQRYEKGLTGAPE